MRSPFAPTRAKRAVLPELKVDGDINNQTLDADILTTAKLPWGDYFKDHHTLAVRPAVSTFSEACAESERDLLADHSRKPARKPCGHGSVKTLRWICPDVDNQAPVKISRVECRKGPGKFVGE